MSRVTPVAMLRAENVQLTHRCRALQERAEQMSAAHQQIYALLHTVVAHLQMTTGGNPLKVRPDAQRQILENTTLNIGRVTEEDGSVVMVLGVTQDREAAAEPEESP